MKQLLSFKLAVIGILLILSAGCKSTAPLAFSGLTWSKCESYRQIMDKDSTYRITFGDGIWPDPMILISSADSIAKYPGMDKFLKGILHDVNLEGSEILFYAPEMQTMFVLTGNKMPKDKPSSVSYCLDDENPYTMWIYDEDVEDWTLKPKTAMNTYTYYDKRKKQLLIVDYYDYGTTPVAEIIILQSNTKSRDKMNIPNSYINVFYKHDLGKIEDDIEFWSHQVDAHRGRAFDNYRLGQELKTEAK